jgi:hypothetical protein
MDLISNFNSYSNGTAIATLQVFKFYSYESVFLECSVKVCLPGTSPTACMVSKHCYVDVKIILLMGLYRNYFGSKAMAVPAQGQCNILRSKQFR